MLEQPTAAAHMDHPRQGRQQRIERPRIAADEPAYEMHRLAAAADDDLHGELSTNGPQRAVHRRILRQLGWMAGQHMRIPLWEDDDVALSEQHRRLAIDIAPARASGDEV